ncbi:MAG: 60S ribosomal export protein NMD3 [Candidatus Diapherotrites archaeon]|uniref:60S ribosomal export protein NMD3 n=1 Tax=Candidatus Iainarchaeum sp. TaxID=3101447 RepID=A0A8T4KSQ0_9ARCH|nr:60S ribosomal export protein NMD3 [Candidatus Diapherotrites archaeon]
MLIKRFCPRCGKETNALIKGFCRECFLKGHEILIVDEELKFPRCKSCGKIRIRGAWFSDSPKNLEDFIRSKMKLKEITNEKINIGMAPNNDGSVSVQIGVSGTINEDKIEFEKEILLKPAIVLCDPCMRLVSDYHEAILQVRFGKKPSDEQVESEMARINKMLEYEKKADSLSQAIKTAEATNGFDVYIGSAKAARRIAEALAKRAHTRVVSSSKLMGVDSNTGKANKRFTYCARV